MMMRGAVAMALLMSLPGCLSTEAVEGPNYPVGFTDGCRTGEAEQSSFSSKVYRDKLLFDTDQSYRAGWRSGYQQCNRLDDLDNRPGDLGEQTTY